ncbi:MAG: ferrous iron transport protein A [Candidatus Melainabacteria bacterium]|nr:ferrous iron transport protein A [Candidatus Melainabacteria bacterium]MBI3307944.1 ferrous iron transport protein A [Candidatus Melainabacteria bacterium]
MQLVDAPNNTDLKVVSIKDEKLLSDAYRFGIEEGEIVKIINKLPNGPIVIQKNEQQIAIGRELAKAIEVETKN